MGLTRYTVTRLPGAPPRRAGQEWPPGESAADLTEAEAAAIAADPGYRLLAVAGDAAPSRSGAPAATNPAAAPKPKRPPRTKG